MLWLQRLKGLLPAVILKPENFFILFAGLFGGLLVFITPPMQAPDEQNHFMQSYAVSNFDFVWDRFEVNEDVGYGPRLPTSVFTASDAFLTPVAGNPNSKIVGSLYTQYINQPLEPKVTSYEKGGTTYSPIVYIPQAIGISIGKAFNTSPLIMIWLGRLANLVVWILLIYAAIRIIPFAKWAVVVLALNPMTVFLSASLSADVMNIALTFVFIAMLISVIVSRKIRIAKSELVLLSVVLIGLALTKPVNILLVLLLLALPWRKFGTKLKLAGFILGIFLAMGTTYLAWNATTSQGTQESIHFQRPDVDINPTQQLATVISAPLEFIKALAQNYLLVQPGYHGNDVLKSVFGVFGWLDTSIPIWTIVVYILALLLALLYQLGRGAMFSVFQKGIFLTVFLGLCLSNIIAMYLIFTPLGSSVIEGVQGRYFIPALILLVAIFTSRKKIIQLSEKQLSFMLGIGMVIVLSMLLLRVFMRYYVV